MADYESGTERTRGVKGSYATVQNMRKLPYVRGAGKINPADRAMLSKFFDKAPFFAQSWDIYHFEDIDNSKDFFLLSMNQIENFLNMIREETGVVLKKPPQFNFPEEAYSDELALLGTAKSDQEYEDLIATIAPPDYENTKGNVKSMTTKVHKQYKSEKKRWDQLVHGLKQVVLCRRWLGFEDAQDLEEVKLRTLFVCVDVESHELNHSAILEVGVTSLDTAELWGASGNEEPPKTFDELWSKVNVRHLRIKENRFLKNGRFVSDCSDKFGFGESEWVALPEASAVIAQCFRFPDGGAGRVVFVGHDAGTDKAYLKKLGYNPDNVNGLETIDTAKMWKAIKQETNPKGLGGLCKELDIVAWNLHNAGNDAAYTFQCLLKMALDHCPDRNPSPASAPLPTPAPEKTNQGPPTGGMTLNLPRVHPAMPRGPQTTNLSQNIWNRVATNTTIETITVQGDGYGWDDSEELQKEIQLVSDFLPVCIRALKAGNLRDMNTEPLKLWRFYEKFGHRFGLTSDDFWWKTTKAVADAVLDVAAGTFVAETIATGNVAEASVDNAPQCVIRDMVKDAVVEVSVVPVASNYIEENDGDSLF